MTNIPRVETAGALVPGNPDGAVRDATREASVRAWLHALWVGVVSTLVAADYPRSRVLALLALQLLCWGPMLLAMASARRRGEGTRTAANALLWVTVVDVILSVAITGGLRSPLALTLSIQFAALFSRYGLSRTGKFALALCCAAVLALATAPATWLGPALGEPYFTFVAVQGAVATLGIHVRHLTLQRESANAALAHAFRAREALAEHAAARSRKLEGVGARLSHELKNRLCAIKPLVQILRSTAADPDTVEQLTVVEGEVERMWLTVQEHLTCSRPRLASIRLGELVRSVRAACAGRAQAAGVQLRASGDALVVADPQAVEEALFNLVGNGIEACAPGGSVEVCVEEEPGGVCISVLDSGRGMAPEILSRIGTPFFTTREEGTGLGVMLARAAFEQHGGTLRYTSEPGRGTRAVAMLPTSRSALSIATRRRSGVPDRTVS